MARGTNNPPLYICLHKLCSRPRRSSRVCLSGSSAAVSSVPTTTSLKVGGGGGHWFAEQLRTWIRVEGGWELSAVSKFFNSCKKKKLIRAGNYKNSQLMSNCVHFTSLNLSPLTLKSVLFFVCWGGHRTKGSEAHKPDCQLNKKKKTQKAQLKFWREQKRRDVWCCIWACK